MNKIAFGVLIGYVQLLINRGIRNGSYYISAGDAQDIDAMINEGMPKIADNVISCTVVDELLSAMQQSRKIDAIKAYQTMTGRDLKESKDAVEKYWPNLKEQYDTIGNILHDNKQ